MHARLLHEEPSSNPRILKVLETAVQHFSRGEP
jgi:hypothetical protein